MHITRDTFERVFKWVDGKEFERAFILWMREICADKELGIVAIVTIDAMGTQKEIAEKTIAKILSDM